MGTPIVVDVFHQQRWDYIYSFQAGGGEREQRRISLFFNKGNLARIDGDIAPKTTATPAPSAKPVLPEEPIL